jgi:hypothetical protein
MVNHFSITHLKINDIIVKKIKIIANKINLKPSRNFIFDKFFVNIIKFADIRNIRDKKDKIILIILKTREIFLFGNLIARKITNIISRTIEVIIKDFKVIH